MEETFRPWPVGGRVYSMGPEAAAVRESRPARERIIYDAEGVAEYNRRRSIRRFSPR